MTHNEKVLALLSDGQPHSHHSLYALNVIAHSRISDLRKRGHTIEMWRDGDDYMYRLQDSAGPGVLPSSEVPPPSPVTVIDENAAVLVGSPAEQLSLVGSGTELLWVRLRTRRVLRLW